jgi:uncharacterized protein
MFVYVERNPSNAARPASIWAISDGRAGNARQAEALAAALAGRAPVRSVVLGPRAPWRWAAPRFLPGSITAFGDAFAAELATPPALVVGCGRQAALATRLLRRQGARAVQVLDPRLDPALWDLVVVPRHDALRGDNVLTTLGGLHPVDDDWLERARTPFNTLTDHPRPRTALLLGGGSRHVPFDVAGFERLARHLDAVRDHEGGSVLATTSRRSSEALRSAVKRRYGRVPHLAWCGEAHRENPYPGLLAWADRIVCSPDSVNMVSEACATRVPVFVFEPHTAQGGPRRFLDTLLASGRIRPLEGSLAPFEAEPLRETARVAAEIRSRLAM